MVAHKGWEWSGKYQHENKDKDRHRLPMWPLWSRRIIAFKLYFALASMTLRDLIFFANGRQVFLAI